MMQEMYWRYKSVDQKNKSKIDLISIPYCDEPLDAPGYLYITLNEFDEDSKRLAPMGLIRTSMHLDRFGRILY